MGDVQATGRDNARRATKRLRVLGYLLPSQDLEVTPSLMLDPDIAAAMLFIGLSEGWYTGRKLSEFFEGGRDDAIGARAMVNDDVAAKGAKIAATHRAFRDALAAAGYRPGGVVASVPTPPVETKPLAPPPYRNPGTPQAARSSSQVSPDSPPAVEPPKPGFWASMLARLRVAYPPKKEN